MPLITIASLKTHIYPGVKTLITQGDDNILQQAIDAAISEAKGYCSRFDIAQLFDNAGNLPGWIADPILSMHVKNMAKWHFINLANPAIDYDDAETRYNNAVDWLKNVQKGYSVPPGWPPAQPENLSELTHISSNKKRSNYF